MIQAGVVDEDCKIWRGAQAVPLIRRRQGREVLQPAAAIARMLGGLRVLQIQGSDRSNGCEMEAVRVLCMCMCMRVRCACVRACVYVHRPKT